MESLSLKKNKPSEEFIESWDDDDDFQCGDDIKFRTVSGNTSVTGSSVRPAGHRDSISSRRSCRSDRDSTIGDDESWQLLLQDNDDSSTEDAIASAKRAGVIIPPDVPKSALLGGTIKRLGSRKPKSTLIDDWWDDLDIAAFDGELQLKLNSHTTSPESLFNLNAPPPSSPAKSQDSHSLALNDLMKFRDTEDDNSFNDMPTIKIANSRLPKPPVPPAQELRAQEENPETGLVIPQGDEPLRLSTRRDVSSTPDLFGEDFDAEWAEGSIGVRFGGTKRDCRSNRSSSISAFSPSLSSCLTMESEDDGIDGLILPEGPVDFKKSLQNRQQSTPENKEETPSKPNIPKHAEPANDDFFTGIEIGNGEAFDSGKLTLNRNIKRKFEQPASPARRRSTSITFTSRNTPPGTRIPRLSAHERAHSTQLEPVSESGGPVPKPRRPHSRIGGHGTNSSLSNIPLPNAHHMPSIASSLSPPSRRHAGGRTSREGLRNEPTTTNAQLLKAKRSAPAIPPLPGNATASLLQRSPPRQEGTYRPSFTSRPKTPVERLNGDQRFDTHRLHQTPFLPAGTPQSKSHHAGIKTGRSYRRTDSDSSGDIFLNPRSASKTPKWSRSDTPSRVPNESLTRRYSTTRKKSITKPSRRNNFGDGTELDIFDDLPTSAVAESEFMKQPVKRGAPRSLRNRLSQSHITPPTKTESPVISGATFSPPPQDFTPRFARDTNASRNAREQRFISMNQNQRERDSNTLNPSGTNSRPQTGNRSLGSPTFTRSRHSHKGSIGRPHLIKPMGSGVQEAKCKAPSKITEEVFEICCILILFAQLSKECTTTQPCISGKETRMRRSASMGHRQLRP